MDVTTAIVSIVSVLSSFGTIVALIYLFFRSRNKIRLALIESGRDATIFRADPSDKNNLKWGIVGVMIGLGLLVASFIDDVLQINAPVAYFSAFFLFGGMGLLSFYFFVGRKAGTETQSDDVL